MNSSISPESHIREAQALQRGGRLAQAEEAYQRILAQWPALPECWFNLAVVQRLQGSGAAALASYHEALTRGVSRPEEAHLNRAVIYSDELRREEDAERELLEALRLNPAYVPALINLANLHEDRGERQEARALYGRALAIDPMCFLAFARLVNLLPRGTHDEHILTRLREALERPEASPADRAQMGFALGRALDGNGEYSAAFTAYERANADSRASGAPPAVYDRAAHEAIVDELIATSLPVPVSAPVPARPRPFFICGMYRSGSTLTEQLLGGHPDVGAGGELSLLPTLITRELLPFPAALARTPASHLARLAAGYRASTAALFPASAFVTDKRPDNFFCLGLIKTLFPDALVVHTTRDPLDTCLSVFFLHLNHRMSYALDLMDIGHFYRQYHRLMAHWRHVIGASIIDFNYDQFVRAPEAAASRLFASLGLEWDARYLDFPRSPGSVKTASVWQVREPLYQHASGRARHYAAWIAPLRAYLADLMPAEDPPAGHG